MELEEQVVRSHAGRRLSVWVPEGRGDKFLLVHSGTPEAGFLSADIVSIAAQNGFTPVGYSRPGYPNSDRHPGRRVGDCASDVLAIADALDIDSFSTVGWSCGGPHALSCAAQLPDRVRAVATVGSSAPRRADGIDWYAGMAVENRKEFGAAEAGCEVLRRLLEGEAVKWCSAGPEDVTELFGELDVGQQMTLKEKERSLEAFRKALAMG